MIVLPAIDIKDGEAVRLYKGDYQQKTVYHKQPEELAKAFEKMGATYLHVVDLDGAKDGKRVNTKTIQTIKNSTTMKIEVGGGIRDLETVSLYLDQIKIDRVILGTVAIENPTFLKEVLAIYGAEKIVVGVDIRDGYVSTAGWLSTSKTPYLDFIKELENLGVRYIVVTDISKDGTLQGPNLSIYEEIEKNTSMHFVVSGGIKDAKDILTVASKGYYGCIVGKAYYEGKVDIQEVIACLPKESSHV